MIDPVRWEDDAVSLIEQTVLPVEHRRVRIESVEEMWAAIKRLAVRGAPAIGIAAAYGMVLAARNSKATTAEALRADLRAAGEYLSTSRPTAVNLFWAVDRMLAKADACAGSSVDEMRETLLAEAHAVLDEDMAMCRAIGANALPFVPDGARILTHCNAGGLATAGYGTALAVVFAAHEAGKNVSVWADETRPLLQGARLTAWELMEEKIPVTLICDNMAAQVMREGRVDMVVVGADRIAASGDAANKIGTYGVALLADAHDIPFYVAAPSSTFDLACPDGDAVPIEERDPEEVTCPRGMRIAPEGVDVYNPAFDVTPARLIAALFTERGVVEHPTTEKVRAHLAADQP